MVSSENDSFYFIAEVMPGATDETFVQSEYSIKNENWFATTDNNSLPRAWSYIYHTNL